MVEAWRDSELWSGAWLRITFLHWSYERLRSDPGLLNIGLHSDVVLLLLLGLPLRLLLISRFVLQKLGVQLDILESLESFESVERLSFYFPLSSVVRGGSPVISCL